MDTLAYAKPSPAVSGVRPVPHIDLPDGTPLPEASPAAAEALPRRPVPKRTWLLAGVAVAGVLGVIGSGIGYTLYRTSHPARPASSWLGMPQAVSPQNPLDTASQPATASRPAQGATTPAPGTPAVPDARAPSAPANTALPTITTAGIPFAPVRRTGADDLRALKPPGPSASATPPPAAASVPTATAAQDTTASLPAASLTEGKAVPAVASGMDPAKAAATPAAEPSTPSGDSDVIGMVTELAQMIGQERRADAELRQQLTRLLEDTDSKLSRFEQRLSVAEAGLAVGGARAAGERVAPPSATPVAAPVSARVPSPARTALPPSASSSARRYEIRAASPGVAVLGTLDGPPSVIEIAVGDRVPGYGRVNAITQKGSAWTVQCEQGLIQ